MSRRPGARSLTVTLIAAASLLGAAGLSSCASGNDAMTNYTRTTTNSVSGSVGTIALRNVYVAGPAEAGASTQVVSAFFNGGADPDEIIGISSPTAASGTPPADSTLPSGDTKIFVADGDAPTLVGLSDKLLIGSELPVTFTFAKAGSVTLRVPVEPPVAGQGGEQDTTESETGETEAPSSPGATEPATTSPTTTEPGATAPSATAPATTVPGAAGSAAPSTVPTTAPGTIPTP